MKTGSLVLLLVCTMFFQLQMEAQSARGVRIGYVDMEYILENVEEYRQATQQLDAKVKKWKVEIEQKQAVVDQMKEDLRAEKVLLTPELIEEREEDIGILEKEVIEYQQDRFGPQGDLVLQKRLLIQPIQDQVFNATQKIGGNKRYDFIFDKSADVVMLYAQERHDISDLILRDIARTRKISKPKEGQMESRLKDFQEREGNEVEEVPNDAVLERQERSAQAQKARSETIDQRREEKLKLREERKKAYEARRKKLLEEREAKKKKANEEKEVKSNDESDN